MPFYVLIDNTKDLDTASMTPKLIEYFRLHETRLVIVSEPAQLNALLCVRNDVLGIILGGGPILLSEKTQICCYSKNLTALIEFPKTPILGICFGYQLLGVVHGGSVESLGDSAKTNVTETIYRSGPSLMLNDLPDAIEVFQCHSDYLSMSPPNFRVTARNAAGQIEAIENAEHLRFGVQFHPENSKHGHLMLNNFCKICEHNYSCS